MSIALGSVIFPVVVALQLLASVTVYEYVPAAWLKLPALLSGPVPPLALTVTVESPPLQAIGVWEELMSIALVSPYTTLFRSLQLLASVTVYEYVPAA